MWRSCWRSPTCWPPNLWPTAISSSRYCTGYERFERYLLGVDDGVAQVAAVGGGDLRAAGRRARRARPADGLGPHDRHGQLVAAADAARRAGTVDGDDPGGDARPDRPSRRRFRPRLRVDERTGVAAVALPAAVTAAGPQPGRDVHPRRRDQRHAAAPGRTVRLQRPTADLSGHQAGLLGRRQPVPPPSEHSAAAARTGPRRHVVVHDPYWTAMAKHADIVVPSTTAFERDDYSGSRNDPLFMAMPALHRAVRRSPRRLHDIRSAGATALGIRRAVHRGPHRRGSGWRTSTTSGPLDWISRCPPFDEFWRRGPTAVADRDRPDPARRLPRRS